MLQISNLNVFIGHKTIINQVNFDVEAGEIIGLIGPNGSGKTTIMKTILGLTKFTGEIQINGHLISENNHRYLKKVGALIEHPAIYPFLTGFQNLKLYANSEYMLNKVVNELEMTEYIHVKTKNYSLGMKQKLGIATALLNEPELVILDEPMNGLDIQATILIRNIIQKYAEQGTAFLISSHVLSELQKIMTGAVLINQGKVVVNQSMAAFKKINQQKYQLLTNNMGQTSRLLDENGIIYEKSEGYFIVSQALRHQIQELLFTNNIQLLELSPKHVSFEQTIIKLLDKQKETIK